MAYPPHISSILSSNPDGIEDDEIAALDNITGNVEERLDALEAQLPVSADEIAVALGFANAAAMAAAQTAQDTATALVATNLATEITNRAADVDAEEASRIAADALKAPIASPTFTGTVTSPGTTNTGAEQWTGTQTSAGASIVNAWRSSDGGFNINTAANLYLGLWANNVNWLTMYPQYGLFFTPTQGATGYSNASQIWIDSSNNFNLSFATTKKILVNVNGSGSFLKFSETGIEVAAIVSLATSAGSLLLGGRAATDGTDSAAIRLHADNHATYPGAYQEFAPLDTRAASTAFAVAPVAAGDTGRAELQDNVAATTNCVANVDSAGTVTFLSGSDAKYVNSSSPASGEIGVYISAGVLYGKPGSSFTGKIASFSRIGKA